jgi:type IV secretory pathway VirB4 component
MEHEQKLKNINESLKKMQREMNPEFLEPSHLEWGAFLEKISSITELYKELISQITPDLKEYITYPIKFDSYDSSVPSGNLLALEKTNLIVNQREENKEEYQNYLAENGVADADLDTRMKVVLSDIEAHNNACKESLSRIEEMIRTNDLIVSDVDSGLDSSMEQAQFPLFDLMDGALM